MGQKKSCQGREQGFTLMEVLAALGIFAILMTGIEISFVNNLKSNLSAEIRYEAMQAAQAVIDEIRFEDIATLSGARNENIAIGPRTYAVAVTYCKNPAFCISDEIRHITVDVKYKAKQIYETDTVFTKFQ